MANWLQKLTDATGVTNYQEQERAVKNANAALEAAKSTTTGINADTQALMNPMTEQMIKAATDAAMANFGGAGNLYSSGAQMGVGNAAAQLAANEYQNAANRALQMQQGNAGITSGIGANKIAGAQSRNMLGEIAGIAKAFV